MAEDASSELGDAIACFQSAETREDYEHALARVVALIPALDVDQLTSARLVRAKCLLALERPDEARVALVALLEDIPLHPEESPHALAAARLTLAEALRACGQAREAIDAFLALVPYFRDQENKLSEGNVLHTVGEIWQELGELGHAIDSLRGAREVLESVEPSPSLQHTLHTLGHAYYLAGDLEHAIESEEECLRLARSFGAEEPEQQLVHDLAEFCLAYRDFPRALQYVRERLVLERSRYGEEPYVRNLAYLGVCYTEIGAARSALKAFDTVEEQLAAQDREDSDVFVVAACGRARALVDLKRFDEARPILSRVRALMARKGADTGLLDEAQRRLERETRGPLVVDCVHRPLLLALGGATKDLSHSNPPPVVDLCRELSDDDLDVIREVFDVPDLPALSELLPPEDLRLSELADALQADLLQARADITGPPGAPFPPLRFEYVDDVQAFERRWSGFNDGRRDARHRAEVQAGWEAVKDIIPLQEGPLQGQLMALLDYVGQLDRVARVYAGWGTQEQVREVALHAADFIEIETDDPMVAAAVWSLRLRLLVTAHAACPRSGIASEEMQRCLDREQEVLRLLDPSRRVAALTAYVVQTWYTAARDVRQVDLYTSLVDLVAGHAHELDDVNRIRHAIAVGSQHPARGTEMLDALLAEVTGKDPENGAVLAADFATARATMRFRAHCPDAAACKMHYGPFAPYIYNEVGSWDESIFFEEPPGGEPVSLGARSVHAFRDGHLVVMRRESAEARGTSPLHQTVYRQLRPGQRLRVDDGRWLRVKRDVPAVCALAYLLMLCEGGEDALPDRGISRLLEAGIHVARTDPQAAAANVRNTLRYFDDLAGRQPVLAPWRFNHMAGPRPASSYAAGALLLGIALGLYGADQYGKAGSYLHHLGVVDHDEAYAFGLREAALGCVDGAGGSGEPGWSTRAP